MKNIRKRIRKLRENIKLGRHTYLMLSVWVLYSMMVLGGRLRTRRRVSRIRAVVAWSLAVLFQMEIMSSCTQKTKVQRCDVHKQYLGLCSSGSTWKRTDTTAPQISSPTMNCSPSMARIRFSQHREARPFLRRMIHFPPILLASSWTPTQNEVLKLSFLIKVAQLVISQAKHWPPTWV